MYTKFTIHKSIVERRTENVIIDEVLEMPNAYLSLSGKRHYNKSEYRKMGFREYYKTIKENNSN